MVPSEVVFDHFLIRRWIFSIKSRAGEVQSVSVDQYGIEVDILKVILLLDTPRIIETDSPYSSPR